MLVMGISKKKDAKKRASKYNEKLAIKGTFANVFKVVKKNKEEKNSVQE